MAAIAPRKVNDVLSEFVDWLATEGIVFASYGVTKERTRDCKRCGGRGFDPRGMTARQAQLLRRGLLADEDRPPCENPDCDDGMVWESYVDRESLQEIHEPYARLFARFLDIDEDAVERERRALLDRLAGRC